MTVYYHTGQEIDYHTGNTREGFKNKKGKVTSQRNDFLDVAGPDGPEQINKSQVGHITRNDKQKFTVTDHWFWK